MSSLAIDLKGNREAMPWWRGSLNHTSAPNQLELAYSVVFDGLKTIVRDMTCPHPWYHVLC